MLIRLQRMYRKPVVQKSLLCLWAGLFLFAACKLGGFTADYIHNRQVMKEAGKLYHGDGQFGRKITPLTASVSQHTPEGGVRPQFRSLLELNRDIVGWLTIDGTPIDYPIVQAADNDYYLYRNYKREDTRAGSIFMDFRNHLNSGNRNTVIYGHRMKDGSMFGALKEYLDKDFLTSHRTMYYDTLFGGYDIEIFAVYRTTVDVDYIQTSFSSDQEFSTFIDDAKQRSLYRLDTAVTAKDRIITLSTCDYMLDPEAGRLVVQGKIVKRATHTHVSASASL